MDMEGTFSEQVNEEEEGEDESLLVRQSSVLSEEINAMRDAGVVRNHTIRVLPSSESLSSLFEQDEFAESEQEDNGEETIQRQPTTELLTDVNILLNQSMSTTSLFGEE